MQDFISNITRTLYFQCRNFFFCQVFLATFFSLTISLQDIFLWNHPYPLLKVKWSIPNPNWPHCCQCSMLTCSVLTRPQHCGIAALPKGSQGRKERKQTYRVFSHDVTVAILVSQNDETAAMLVSQTNPVGVGLFSYANTFFCSNKSAKMMATWVKTLHYKVYVTIRTHTYVSLWYEPKFNWLRRLYKTPIFISLILKPVKMLS